MKTPDFGDRVKIEMFRYGVPNEFYTHKVINNLRSNTWQDVPLKGGESETIHPGTADTIVLSVICEGILENRVFRVRAEDCELI